MPIGKTNFKTGDWIINIVELHHYQTLTYTEKDRKKLRKGKCLLQVIDVNERSFQAELSGLKLSFTIEKFRLATEHEIKLIKIKNIF